MQEDVFRCILIIMRVIFFKRHAWTILLAICIFIGGNIVLFYKFMVRKELEHKRAQELAKQYFQALNARPSSRLANLANYFNKKNADESLENLNRIKTDQIVSKGVSRSKVSIETIVKVKDANNLGKQNGLGSTHQRSDPSQKEERNYQLNQGEKASHGSELINPAPDYKFGILVIACNRPTVRRCLDLLIKYRPSPEEFPIVVSQDCGDSQTAEAIKSYGDQVIYIQQPDLGDVKGVPSNMIHFMGYYKISRHFKWALSQMFDIMNYNTVIIIEDDLDIAPDFFEYFTATRPLLDQDQSLWCVSAWNDNGKEEMVKGNDLLYRTDFFSGLGWMLTKTVWEELRSKWPLGFWDDWMREPAQHKNRSCIRPEICRTRTFGKVGVSKGQFFDQHLKFIKLNDEPFPFTKTDLSYLLKKNYDQSFKNKISRIPRVTVQQLRASNFHFPEVKVQYSSNSDFEQIAKSLGVMSDFKAGVARVSYYGVVSFMFRGTRVFIAPKNQM